MYCPNCGTENLDTSKFCKSCGSPLVESKVGAQNTDTPPLYQTYSPDGPQQPVTGKPKKQKKEKSSKKGKIILAVVLAIVVILGAVAAYLFTRPEIKLGMAIKRTDSISGMKIDLGGRYSTEFDFDSLIVEFGSKTSDSKCIISDDDEYYIYVDGKSTYEVDIDYGYSEKYSTEDIIKEAQDYMKEPDFENDFGSLGKVKLEDLISSNAINWEYIADTLKFSGNDLNGVFKHALKNKTATIESTKTGVTIKIDTYNFIFGTLDYLKNNNGKDIVELVAKLFDYDDIKEFEEDLKDEIDEYKEDNAIKDIEIEVKIDGGKITGISGSYGKYLSVEISNFNMTLKESFDDNDTLDKIVDIVEHPEKYEDEYEDDDYDYSSGSDYDYSSSSSYDYDYGYGSSGDYDYDYSSSGDYGYSYY